MSFSEICLTSNFLTPINFHVMKSTNTYVPEVAKEKLTGMRFPEDDVLPLYDQRADRKRLLQRAADFGNYAQYKIVILFEDDESVKRVETTIWDIDEFLK